MTFVAVIAISIMIPHTPFTIRFVPPRPVVCRYAIGNEPIYETILSARFFKIALNYRLLE